MGMPGHRFSYPFFEPPGGFPRPYLPIRLTNPQNGKVFTWDCMIDTGADTCLFSRSLAEALGHNLTGKGVKHSLSCGVEGSPLLTWKHTFILELLHPRQPHQVVWRGRRQKIECVHHDHFPPLLGVQDFLQYFKVTLDYHKGVTTLEW
jgi:hypothetical protein